MAIVARRGYHTGGAYGSRQSTCMAFSSYDVNLPYLYFINGFLSVFIAHTNLLSIKNII